MAKLVLTKEQSDLVCRSAEPIEVFDASGNELGRLPARLTPARVAELKRLAASPGPRYTGAQVQARLRALQEEWEKSKHERDSGMKPVCIREGHLRTFGNVMVVKPEH